MDSARPLGMLLLQPAPSGPSRLGCDFGPPQAPLVCSGGCNAGVLQGYSFVTRCCTKTQRQYIIRLSCINEHSPYLAIDLLVAMLETYGDGFPAFEYLLPDVCKGQRST